MAGGSSPFLLGGTGFAFGQLGAYDPYAQEKEESPISADGKVIWPSFFRNPGMEAKYQAMFQTGNCVGTRKSTVAMLKENKVDVNQLPQAALAALAVGVRNGLLAATDVEGKTVMLVMHPRGVSQVDVEGEIAHSQLAAGMTVRFLGKVDAQGHGSEPLKELEVLTPGPDHQPEAVAPNHLQTIQAVVTKNQYDHLRLKVLTGKLKMLSFDLAADAKISVAGHSIDLISQGDEVQAEGHVFSGEGGLGSRTLFADKILVKKHLLHANPAKSVQ